MAKANKLNMVKYGEKTARLYLENGIYKLVISHKTDEGKYKNIVRGTGKADLRDARTQGKEILKKYVIENSNTTLLSGLRDEWLRKKYNKSENHKKGIYKAFDKAIEYFGDTPILYLTPEHIDDFDIHLSKLPNKKYPGKKLSQNYIHNIHRNFKTVWSFGLKKKMVEHNIYEDFKVEQSGLNIDWLTSDELQDIIEKSKPIDELLSLYMELLIRTGFRLGELANLEWNDIKKDANGNYEYFILKDTKTGDFIVSIDDYVNPVLKRIRKLHNNKTYVVAYADTIPNPKYKRMANKRFQYDPFGRKISNTLTDLGYAKYTAHHFRHSYATNLCILGYDLQEVMILCRHKYITTTMKYFHLTDKHIKKNKDILRKKAKDFYGDSIVLTTITRKIAGTDLIEIRKGKEKIILRKKNKR